MNTDIKIEISDFLGYCSLNGVEALDSDYIERLEQIIRELDASEASGVELVADSLYDRLKEILAEVNPDSELLSQIWSEDEETDEDNFDDVLSSHPMLSIETVKDYSSKELLSFIDRLPSDVVFSIHASAKLNGHGIRMCFEDGIFKGAFSRGRSTNGRVLTSQARSTLSRYGLLDIPDLEGAGRLQVKGEYVVSFDNYKKAKEYNSALVSPFSSVSSVLRDSASPEELELLDFVAYKIEGYAFNFETKEEEYEFLEDLGFKTPMSWVIEGITKETVLETLPDIIDDCESCCAPYVDEDGETITPYEFYTDGIVYEINERDLFHELGMGDRSMNGNIALKVGFWQQNLHWGTVQCILWTEGKQKLSPVAIVSDTEDAVITDGEGYIDEEAVYIRNISQISNYKDIGVLTSCGNRVRRIPLYEPANLVLLEAYVGNPLYFRYGGEAGVVPCFQNGMPLRDFKLASELSNESLSDDDDENYSLF